MYFALILAARHLADDIDVAREAKKLEGPVDNPATNVLV